MPSTFKGTGTTYSGQENVHTRVARCEHCKNVYELASYDTKLYFCVFGVPLIPLGDKHVINMCPGCTKHRVVEGKEWARVSEEAVNNAKQTFATAPTESNALKTHLIMLEFGRPQDAAEFRQSVQQFNHSAQVQAGFGEMLHEYGFVKEAEPYYSLAYDLDSSLPAARAGIAREYIRAGDLDSARTLLDFLERPGSEEHNSIAPLEDLADAAQAKGQHEMALQLYTRLLQALPVLGTAPGFRKKVIVSEKALRRPTSILPSRQFSAATLFSDQPIWDGGSIPWKTASIGILVLAVLGGGAAAYNEHVRTNRSVYVVSGLPDKTNVEIVGVGKVDVDSKAEQKLTLKEGKYQVNIGGTSPRTVELVVDADYFSRFFDNAVWLVNVNGSAIVVEEHATYKEGGGIPSEFQFHYGEETRKVAGIHHPFEDLPKTVSLKKGRTKKLVGLSLYQGELSLLLDNYFADRPDQYYKLLEWQLNLDPSSVGEWDRYLKAAQVSKSAYDRLDTFIARSLKKPFHVEWHEMYRRMRYSKERDAKLTALYDEAIKADPKDGEALFLRGEVDPADPNPWFQKAIAADAECAWPYIGMARKSMAQADWTNARKNVGLALDKEGGQPESFRGLLTICLGQGDASELENSFRTELKTSPAKIMGNVYLIIALAAQDKAAEAKEVVTQYAKAVKDYGEEGKNALHIVERTYFYATGDFKALYTLSHNAGPANKEISGEDQWTESVALLEQGRTDDAAKVFPYFPSPLTVYQHMAVDLAYRAEGKLAAADKWEKLSLQGLDAGLPEDVKVAEILRSTTPPDVAAVKALDVHPADKALLCTLLGAKHPTRQTDYFTMARALNVMPKFPWQMVNRLASGKFTFPLPK